VNKVKEDEVKYNA
jgi:hypothetical protein